MDRLESLFCDCVAADGRLDVARFEATCAQHGELAVGLKSLRASFEAGQRALGGRARDGLLETLTNDWSGPRRFDVDTDDEVGRGGMGVVLRAWDPKLRRAVALKAIRADEPATDRARLRLMAEAQVLGQLQHPGVVPVHELDFDARLDLFFTMPLVAGETLVDVIEHVHDPGSEWNLPRLLGAFLRVCETMAYAHSRGVIHRDLKPANVMVGPFGEVYVMDWGLAKARGVPEPRGPATAAESDSGSGSVSSVRTELADRTPESSLLSRDGQVVGTPAYMPPEQADGRVSELDERADVYAVGAMLYHALAGRPPYSRQEGEPRVARERLLERVRRAAPARLSEVARRAPPELVAIAEKAMEREPEQRYPSMLELANDLRAHLEGRVVRAHAQGAWPELAKWMGRHRWIVASIAAVFATVAGAAVALWLLYQTSEDHRVAAQVAQADSLRRLGALQGVGAADAVMPSFREDFEAGPLSRRWIVKRAVDRVRVADGGLALEAPPSQDGPVRAGLDPFVSVLRGDFEAIARYRLEGFTIPDVERGERIAAMRAVDASSGRAVITIGRHAERHPLACDGLESSYRSAVTSSEVVCAPATGVSGHLRVARAEGRIAVSYRDAGGSAWKELAARPVGSEAPLTIEFQATNFYAPEPFRFIVDELSIVAQERPVPRSISGFRPVFGPAGLDPRLRVAATAGVVAGIEGRLHMEKLVGRRGHVILDLDPYRWALQGDFEVGFDFHLTEVPTDSDAFLALRLRSDEAHFATIEIHNKPDRRFYKAFHHVRDERRPTEDERGRLRIRRVDDSVFMEYWDDGWVTLLEREHVARDLRFYFRLELAAPESEQVFVGVVDGLYASAIERR